jgi:hypothetical protein
MHRRLCSFVLIAGVCIAATFVPLSSGAAGTSLPSCSTTQLVPSISELVVNQGLPTYTRLARGKEALVRAYLTLPSNCALTRTQKIEPTSATLTVNNGSAQPQLANEGTLSGAIGSAAQISSTADPYFVVPFSYLAPTANAAAFSATFTLQVTYKRTDGSSVATAATNATKTVPVDKRTNALRVLVVPIGDPTAGTVQFSPDANTAVQNMMTAASRAFPVPTGTGDLSPTGPTATGGIRYAIAGGLLDARSLGLYTNGKFCSNATNFGTSLISGGAFAGLTLKGQLQQALSDYNSANQTKPADMVLGVADESSSWASSSGVLCPAPATASPGGPDDGRASGPTAFAIGKPSWARITYNGVSSPAFMEMAHNLGICRATGCVGLHSQNVQADVTAVNRGMNVTQRKVLYAGGALGDDHSAMNYNPTIPYSINNILLEPNDWKDVLCDLGGVDSQIGTPFSACPLGSAPGTSVSVAANLDINGTTDGTNARVTNSYSTALDTGLRTVEDPGSTTKLLLQTGTCAGSNTTLLDYGLPVEKDDGHTDDDFNGDPLGAANAFHGLVPFPTGTTTVKVVVNGNLKYCRSATAAPDVTDTTVQPLGAAGQLLRSFATPVAGGGGRGMAFDGNTLWTSFATGTNIYQVSTTGSLLRTVGVGHTIGALAYDAGNGHLYGGNYDPSANSPDAGKVYDITTGVDPTTADKFTFIPTGTACRGGELGAIDGLELLPSGGFAISGDAANTLFLTNSVGVSSTSFPVTCNSGITTDGANGLWRVDLNAACCGLTSTIVHSDLAGNQLGSFSFAGYEPEDIAYDSVTFAPQCALWMNEAGTAVIRAYSVPCGGTTPPATTKAVTFTATGGDLVGTAYVTCGDNSPKYPVADSLSPVDTEAAVKSFSFAFTSTLSCGNTGNATVITTVSNGLYQSSLTDDPQARKTFDSTDKPPAPAIAAPVNGANFGVGSKIAYNGSAFDAEDGALSGDQSLKWYLGVNQIGTDRAFDLPAPSAGNYTVKLVATDSAGHTASKEVTIHVDGTPPLLAMSPGVNSGSTSSENVTASDVGAGNSGLANLFCSVDNLPATLTPPLTDPYSGSFTYSSGIIHQLSCTALDRAGNQTTVNAISQFAPASVSCVGAPGRTVLQPVNPDGSSVFKKGGSTVPVKFRVCDAAGNSIGPSQVVDFQRATPPAGCTATPTPAAARVPVLCKKETGLVGGVDEAVISTNPDTSFRWSPADRAWVFNLATSNLASGSKYTYYIPLIDDTNIFFTFGVK